jgi:hypothetical protein
MQGAAQRLRQALGLAPGEAGALPMVPGPSRCITYGPLDTYGSRPTPSW